MMMLYSTIFLVVKYVYDNESIHTQYLFLYGILLLIIKLWGSVLVKDFWILIGRLSYPKVRKQKN